MSQTPASKYLLITPKAIPQEDKALKAFNKGKNI